MSGWTREWGWGEGVAGGPKCLWWVGLVPGCSPSGGWGWLRPKALSSMHSPLCGFGGSPPQNLRSFPQDRVQACTGLCQGARQLHCALCHGAVTLRRLGCGRGPAGHPPTLPHSAWHSLAAAGAERAARGRAVFVQACVCLSGRWMPVYATGGPQSPAVPQGQRLCR